MKIKNIISELRLTRVFLLVGLFLLVSSKSWAQPVVNFNADIIIVCSGSTVTFTNLTVGPSGSATYIWDFGTGAEPNTSPEKNPPAVTYTGSGTVTVSLTMTDGIDYNETKTDYITIAVIPAAPTITAGGPTTFCSGGSVTLTSSTGDSYLWSTLETTASITVSTTGIYTVQVTDVNGCVSAASAAITVTVNPLPTAPTITADVPTTFCEGGSVTLTSSAGDSYLWSTLETTASITVSTTGIYTVQVTDVNGCVSAASAATTVTVNPLPTTSAIFHY